MTLSLIVTTANLRKETPRRKRIRYTRRLKKITRKVAKRRTGKRRILARQEVGHGTRSTRLRTWKLRASRQRWVEVGRGVHNGVAWCLIRIDGLTLLVMSAHGLHLRTVGRRRQADYYADLRDFIATFEGIDGWILAGDFNRNHKVVARYLGGTSVGHGVDGVVVSAGLKVKRLRVVWWGVRRGLTDHPAIVAQVTAA